MDPVSEVFPLWVIALDYVSGVVMWTLIGRTAMGLFLPEDSSFFFMRFFAKIYDFRAVSCNKICLLYTSDAADE